MPSASFHATIWRACFRLVSSKSRGRHPAKGAGQPDRYCGSGVTATYRRSWRSPGRDSNLVMPPPYTFFDSFSAETATLPHLDNAPAENSHGAARRYRRLLFLFSLNGGRAQHGRARFRFAAAAQPGKAGISSKRQEAGSSRTGYLPDERCREPGTLADNQRTFPPVGQGSFEASAAAATEIVLKSVVVLATRADLLGHLVSPSCMHILHYPGMVTCDGYGCQLP